jgi:hypothetical protein
MLHVNGRVSMRRPLGPVGARSNAHDAVVELVGGDAQPKRHCSMQETKAVSTVPAADCTAEAVGTTPGWWAFDGAGGEVLLQAKLSLRMPGAPIQIPSLVRLVGAAEMESDEPFATLEYTSDRGRVAVPCRAISGVRCGGSWQRSGSTQQPPLLTAAPWTSVQARECRFDVEYVDPRGVRTRLRFRAETREQYQQWCEALGPLPLPSKRAEAGTDAVERARAWLDRCAPAPSKEDEELELVV